MADLAPIARIADRRRVGPIPTDHLAKVDAVERGRIAVLELGQSLGAVLAFLTDQPIGLRLGQGPRDETMMAIVVV